MRPGGAENSRTPLVYVFPACASVETEKRKGGSRRRPKSSESIDCAESTARGRCRELRRPDERPPHLRQNELVPDPRIVAAHARSGKAAQVAPDSHPQGPGPESGAPPQSWSCGRSPLLPPRRHGAQHAGLWRISSLRNPALQATAVHRRRHRPHVSHGTQERPLMARFAAVKWHGCKECNCLPLAGNDSLPPRADVLYGLRSCFAICAAQRAFSAHTGARGIRKCRIVSDCAREVAPAWLLGLNPRLRAGLRPRAPRRPPASQDASQGVFRLLSQHVDAPQGPAVLPRSRFARAPAAAVVPRPPPPRPRRRDQATRASSSCGPLRTATTPQSASPSWSCFSSSGSASWPTTQPTFVREPLAPPCIRDLDLWRT